MSYIIIQYKLCSCSRLCAETIPYYTKLFLKAFWDVTISILHFLQPTAKPETMDRNLQGMRFYLIIFFFFTQSVKRRTSNCSYCPCKKYCNLACRWSSAHQHLLLEHEFLIYKYTACIWLIASDNVNTLFQKDNCYLFLENVFFSSFS